MFSGKDAFSVAYHKPTERLYDHMVLTPRFSKDQLLSALPLVQAQFNMWRTVHRRFWTTVSIMTRISMN